MSLYDLDEALGINQQNTQSKALGNLVSSHGTNPDDYAKRMRLQKSTGTPAVLMDDPEVKAEAEKQHYMQGLAISHTPATARFAADENHAPLITDDVHNLTGFESKMSDLGKNRQPTLNQMRQVMGVDNKPLSAQRLTGETAKNVFAPVPGLAIDAFAEGMAGVSRLALESKYAPMYYLDQYGVKPVFGGTMAEGAAKLGNYFKERGKATEEAYKLEAPDAQAVRSGLVSVGQMLIPMSAGSKFTAGAKTAEEAAKVLEHVVLGTLTAQTTGQAYNKYRDDKGFEPEAAALGAGVEGAIEYGTEKLPVGIISKYLNGMGKRGINGFVTTMAKLGIGEQATEFLATLGQDATEKIMGTPGMTSEQRTQSLADYFTKEDQDGYTEFLRNARSTAIATATMTVATGGLLPVGTRAMESARGKIRQANAEQTQTQLLDALTTAEMSKLKERSPETFANYAQQVADQHGVSSVYFQADKLINAAIQNGVPEQHIPAYLAQYGVTPSQIQEAVHTNGLVELKMGDFVTNFQNDVVLQSLQNDLLIDPNAHAMSEAENGSRLDMEQLQHLNELYQADQGRKINQDDITAWEDAIMATPGLKGKVTSESLMPIIARANVLSQMTDAPAIEHLNRMLQPAGLQAMKHAEWIQAKQEGGGQGLEQNTKGTLPAENLAEFDQFKTGQPVTFGFVHNTESATKIFGKPKKGDRFKRDMEPSGRYVTIAKPYDGMPKNMIGGEITFQNPLVIKGDNWKQVLHDHYKKRGKQLSKALIADGYDGVVTIDKYGPSETLDLTTFDEAKALYQSPNSRQGSETYSIRKTAAEGMLAPAVLKDGKIMAAGIGATHYDVHTEVGQTDGENANGFITPDGQFLSRKQSLEWLKKNRPDAYRALDKETKQNGLESQAYAHAEGLGGNLADEAQRYMESMGLFQSATGNKGTYGINKNNILLQSDQSKPREQSIDGIQGSAPVLGQANSGEMKQAAIILESLVDSSGLSSENFANLLKRNPLSVEESGLVGTPAFSAMLSHVKAAILNDSKVLDTIIGAAPVNVVNYLFGSESAAKVALHNEAMLEDSPAFNADLPVPGTAGDTSGSVRLLVGEVASKTAEVSAVLHSAGLTFKDLSAVGAGQTDTLRQEGPPSKNPLAALLVDTSTTSPQNLVFLFEHADKSSFLHETAHIFLNDLKYVAETYGVQQKEWQEVQQWLGSTDGTITIEQHEKFAEHFEVYLKEGKAPTVELRNAFRMFKKWLTNIYESVKSGRFGQRELTIAPELSDLFDRLLATEQDIKAAREQDALTEMLDVNLMSEVGDSSSQVEEYRNIVNHAEGSAREKMDKHKLVGRDGRLTEWRKQANEESKQVPLYGFIESAIADGGIVRQSVVDLFGEGSVPAMPQLWRNNGNDINVAIAERGADFGYESAGQFIDDIRNMVPRSVWVDKRVAQLEAIYDGGLDTQEAIRTAALRRMMEIESEWLAKRAVNKTTTPRPVMRAWADKIVAGRTMGEIKRVDRMLADSRKKRQQAILEARRGNWEQSLKANEQARMTEELIASSYRAMKSWQSMQTNWKKIAKWTNDNKSVKVGTNYRDQINRLLEQYGIAKKEYDPAAPDLHSFAANMIDDLDGTGATLPAWVGVETDDFKKLNWEQLQDLNDALKYLYGNGRDEVQGRKMTNGEYVAEYAANIAALQDGIKNKPDLHSDATEAGKVLKGIQKSYRKFFANTGILRFIAKRMDGYSDSIGPAEQLVQNIINGMARSNDMWVTISKEIEPQLNILMKDRDKVFIDIPWPELMKREGDSWTKARVVAAALNMGNDSNMMKLLEGYDMTQDQADMIAGKLTAEEWQSIQKIWDAVDSLWPQIVETHEKLKYYRPKKIAARSIEVTTADGQTITLNGGYYPIKYNANLTRKIAAWNEKDDLLASHESIMQVPAAKSGFAKERTGVAYPIDLSLNVLASHLNDTIKFITLSESVRDADRVFQSSVLMDRNLDTLGRDMVNMIRPTLKNVIRPEQNKLGRFFESSRILMSTFYMGYNAWTAIQNVTGVFPAIKQAGFQNYLNGIAHVMGNPLEAHKAMLEASSYMRMREANVERDMKKQMRDFKIGGMEINGKRYTYDDVKSLGFAGIRLIDGIVSLPAWWGKYNAEMEKHGNVQKATEEADATINKALGSGLAIDSTGIGRHPFLSLLAPFMSFAAAQQEVLATAGEAHKQGKISSSEFLYTHLMTWLAPSIMSTFMQGVLMYGVVAALGGGDDDKRKKGLMDYATDLISYRLMGIPFMRDMWNSMLQGFEHKAPITSARMPVVEGFKMLQQLGYKIGNLDGSERTTKAAMWSVAELASLFSGIPATRIYDRWSKGTKQIENGTGWWGNHFVPQEKKK